MKATIFILFLVLYSFSYSQAVEPFLEKFVTQFPNVRDITMTQNKDEILFSAQSEMGDISVILSVKKDNNQWQSPEVISFSGRYFDLEPYFSNDGLSLYFVSNRPLDQTSDTTKDFDIWVVQRETVNNEWSKPVNIGAPINTEMDEFYPSITDSKNLYFTLDNPSLQQKDDIYVSEYKNGSYQTPKRLGDGVNSEGYEFNAYVSPDESYLIYTCYNKEGGFGSGDLHISTKLESGNWSSSKNMGETINSDKMDYCPFVEDSSNTLYFTSKRNSLKPTFASQTNLIELLETFNTYENGASRLYKVNMQKPLD